MLNIRFFFNAVQHINLFLYGEGLLWLKKSLPVPRSRINSSHVALQKHYWSFTFSSKSRLEIFVLYSVRLGPTLIFFPYVNKPSDLAQVIEKTILSSLFCSINTVINQTINQVFIYVYVWVSFWTLLHYPNCLFLSQYCTVSSKFYFDFFQSPSVFTDT